MEQPPQTDEELVRAFQRGDRQAFGQLIERHQDRLHRLALACWGTVTLQKMRFKRRFYLNLTACLAFVLGPLRSPGFTEYFRISVMRQITDNQNSKLLGMPSWMFGQIEPSTVQLESKAWSEFEH